MTTPVPLRRNADFRRYWIGQAVSNLGSGISIVAFPLLVLTTGGSAEQAGLLASLALLTRTVCRLPAGVVVDRFDRRRLMLVFDVVRAISVGTVPAAAAFGEPRYLHLLVVAVVEGIASSMYGPAAGIAIRRLVPAAQLTDALAKSQARVALVSLLAPAVGGALFAVHRMLPFVVDAGSYVFSAVLVYRIATPFGRPAKPRQTDRRFTAGLRWLGRHTVLRRALIYAGVVNLVAAAAELGVIVVLRDRGLGSTGIGLVLACGGAGAVLGAALSARIIKRLPAPVLLAVIGFTWSGALAGFAITTSPWVVGPLLTGLFLLSPAAAIVVSRAILLQTPEDMQGRVVTAAGLLMSGLPAAGPALAGGLLGAFGSAGTWLVLAAGIGITTAATCLPLIGRSGLDETEPVDREPEVVAHRAEEDG